MASLTLVPEVRLLVCSVGHTLSGESLQLTRTPGPNTGRMRCDKPLLPGVTSQTVREQHPGTAAQGHIHKAAKKKPRQKL